MISGFEPFGSFKTNPSYEAIMPLDGEIISGFEVRIAELPVTWADGWTTLKAEIERLKPSVVIATGVFVPDSGMPDYMRIETTGQNLKQGLDNDDIDGANEKIVPKGPKTIAGGLPAQNIADAMNAAKYTAYLSDNAGTYLCNFVFYNLMYYVENEASYDIAAGFIHVPDPALNPKKNGLTIEQIQDAHRVGIAAIAAWMDNSGAATSFIPTVHTPPKYSF